MGISCNLFLTRRCEASKGTSANHIYECVELLIRKYLCENPEILDLGSGVGNFKNFLSSKLTSRIN